MKTSKKEQESFKQLGRHIQKLREERHISVKELSDKTGIIKEYLKKLKTEMLMGFFWKHI